MATRKKDLIICSGSAAINARTREFFRKALEYLEKRARGRGRG